MPNLTDIRMAVTAVNLHMDNVAAELDGGDDEGGYIVYVVYPGTPEGADCAGHFYQTVAEVFDSYGIHDLLKWDQLDMGQDPFQYVHDDDHMFGGFWVPEEYVAQGF